MWSHDIHSKVVAGFRLYYRFRMAGAMSAIRCVGLALLLCLHGGVFERARAHLGLGITPWHCNSNGPSVTPVLGLPQVFSRRRGQTADSRLAPATPPHSVCACEHWRPIAGAWREIMMRPVGLSSRTRWRFYPWLLLECCSALWPCSGVPTPLNQEHNIFAHLLPPRHRCKHRSINFQQDHHSSRSHVVRGRLQCIGSRQVFTCIPVAASSVILQQWRDSSTPCAGDSCASASVAVAADIRWPRLVDGSFSFAAENARLFSTCFLYMAKCRFTRAMARKLRSHVQVFPFLRFHHDGIVHICSIAHARTCDEQPGMIFVFACEPQQHIC